MKCCPGHMHSSRNENGIDKFRCMHGIMLCRPVVDDRLEDSCVQIVSHHIVGSLK